MRLEQDQNWELAKQKKKKQQITSDVNKHKIIYPQKKNLQLFARDITF